MGRPPPDGPGEHLPGRYERAGGAAWPPEQVGGIWLAHVCVPSCGLRGLLLSQVLSSCIEIQKCKGFCSTDPRPPPPAQSHGAGHGAGRADLQFGSLCGRGWGAGGRWVGGSCETPPCPREGTAGALLILLPLHRIWCNADPTPKRGAGRVP